MKEGSRANALLVELLLVIFFFMISAAILVQVFADAKLKSRTAHATNASMLEAQNIADDLYGAEDPDAVLQELGFTKDGDSWILEGKEYTLTVKQTEEASDTGVLRTFTISATGDGKDLFSLPSTRYLPKEVSP